MHINIHAVCRGIAMANKGTVVAATVADIVSVSCNDRSELPMNCRARVILMRFSFEPVNYLHLTAYQLSRKTTIEVLDFLTKIISDPHCMQTELFLRMRCIMTNTCC